MSFLPTLLFFLSCGFLPIAWPTIRSRKRVRSNLISFFLCVCSIRPLYPPPTLSDVSEKCCGMSAFPFFLFLLCVLLLLLASFRRRRRRRRRRSSVAMAPIESDLINLQGELDSELDFAQRKSNAPLHPFSHPCSNPCSIDKMYLLRIYPYRERRKERNIAYHACLPFM